MSDELVKAVRTALLEAFPGRLEGGDDDLSLVDAGLLDSVGVLVLVTQLEERFEIEIRDADVMPENLDSVSRIAAFVARKQNGG